MSVAVTDLMSLPASSVQDQEQLLGAVLREQFPHIDASRGALRTLLLHLSAVLATKNQTEMDRLRQTYSPVELLADPSLADDDLVDRLATNYKIERKAGVSPTGEISIILSSPTETSVGPGVVFLASGRRYIPNATYTSRVSADDLQSANDRVMTVNAQGNYEFIISVTAEEPSIDAQLARGSTLLPTIPLSGFVMAYARETFTEGTAGETNEQLLSRLLQGVSARSIAGRDAMSSALISQFPDVVADSVVGLGDAEMRRDQHTIWPGSLGGRCDWYVQTRGVVSETPQVFTAKITKVRPDNSAEWRIDVDRNTYSGLYELVEIQPSEGNFAGSLDVLAVHRNYDGTAAAGDDFSPDVGNAEEAAFTRYQTYGVTFYDPEVLESPTVGDEKEFQAVVRWVPEIAEIQSWANAVGFRGVASDCLVKAPVPCFVFCRLEVRLPEGYSAASVDTDSIAAVASNTAARFAFFPNLPASAIIDSAYQYLPPDASIQAHLVGRTLLPNGGLIRSHSSQSLEAINQPDQLATRRTSSFFLPSGDVLVEFV